MSDGPLPYKRDVANMLLRKGSLFLHLDPRVGDVVVPPWLRHQAQLVLQVGFDMPIPINDLRVDENGVFGTLSFSRTPFSCLVPWNAVFALVGDEGRGMVWPDSMPAEIVAEVEREAMRAKHSSEPRDAQPGATMRPPPRAPGDGELELRRWSGTTSLDEARARVKPVKEPAVAVLRAAAPDGRPRRDSNRPGAPRSSAKRSKGLPPYLRVVK
jgi:Stringent starvation protein B